MNNPTDNVFEQLSAYMDGELPEAEARFLQRRLEHDAELRGKWARMQLASTCIKGQPWRPMSEKLSERIEAGLSATPSIKPQRNVLRWAMVASIAALAVIFAPRLVRENAPDAPSVASASAAAAPESDHVLARPSSADLIAFKPAEPTAGARTPARAAMASAAGADFIGSNPRASAMSSPMPLSTQSPTDFPLVDSGNERAWPRSELLGTANDPALEAYLVRHNQMLANDGLGGFVPYVDVVANDQPAAAPAADEGADRQ